MPSNILIIGAGAAGSVTTQKCAKDPFFGEIHLASRRLSSCEEVATRCAKPIHCYELDAHDIQKTTELIQKTGAEMVINMALPYQDLDIMEACLAAGVHYLDTANYEPIDEAKFSYSWQWAYHEKFKEKGLMALCGSGFDPGVTNVFIAYANQYEFDEISEVDIVDCNDGDHGQAFATNFNPEINIREVTQNGRYYQEGQWIETEPMEIAKDIDFPEVGTRKGYCLFHEELESLVKHIPSIKRIQFWMTFSEEYITHLRVLENVGLTRIDAINYEGKDIVPLQFLKAVLPAPSSLGENYSGKTCIGCIIKGKKDGQDKQIMIYNICQHQEAYNEVKAQAVSYTTGVPAYIGAKLMLSGTWMQAGVINMEQNDAKPFMDELNQSGLPWKIITPS